VAAVANADILIDLEPCPNLAVMTTVVIDAVINGSVP